MAKNRNNIPQQMIRIPADITESAANTFTEVEIQLPTNVGSGLVFDLDQFLTDFASVGMAANTLGVATIQITRTTQTAILNASDPNLIAKRDHIVTNSSANAGFWTNVHNHDIGMETYDRLNLLALRKVFMGVKGTGQAAALSFSGVLIGTLKKISQAQINSLILEQSL